MIDFMVRLSFVACVYTLALMVFDIFAQNWLWVGIQALCAASNLWFYGRWKRIQQKNQGQKPKGSGQDGKDKTEK